MPEVLDAVASVGKAAANSEEKTMEAPCSAPSRLSFSNLLLHLGDLAVDALQAEAESTAVGCEPNVERAEGFRLHGHQVF